MGAIFENIDLVNKSLSSKSINSNNNLIIYFDGYIYNKNSLNDIEFIKSLYKIYGNRVFEKLDGIFSIAIYDHKNNKLLLARDRAGIYPLYYYFGKNCFIFGTRLRDFYKERGFLKKISTKGVALYLNYGYISQPYTIFENSYKVMAGSYVEFDLNKRELSEHRYWTLEDCYIEKKPYVSEEEVLRDVEELLKKSIEKRVDSLDGIASSLSGGYDSSIVAALLTHVSGKKIDTYTIGFSQKDINEAEYAKSVAKYLNSNHHEYYFKDEDALRVVPKLSEVYDEPFADYGATPTLLMTLLLKDDGFDTLFVGDGGDEVFATADDVKRFENILSINPLYKNILFRVLNSINPLDIPILNSYRNFPTKYYKYLQILKAVNISQMVKIKPILFFDDEIKRLLNVDRLDLSTPSIDFPPNSEAVDEVIGSYFKTSMVDAELVKSFQAANFTNISLREPLLDIDLVQYMSRVPQSIKIKSGEKKYILKQIAHKYIPKELLDRPKSGFDIPFSQWLKGPLKELLFLHINYKRVKEDGLFNPDIVIDIRDNFYKGNDSFKYKLWTLFLFHLWYHKVLSNMNDI